MSPQEYQNYLNTYGVAPAPLHAPPASQNQQSPKGKARRRFIQGLLATGAIGFGGAALYKANPTSQGFSSFGSPNSSLATGSDPVGVLRSDANPNRVLVIVELVGGNDGLSMVVPYTSGTYYDMRSNTAIDQGEVLALTDTLGLHPNLSQLHSRGVTVVAGVGSRFNNLSHFTSEKYWQLGDLTGDKSYKSGFLARCIDPLDQGSPVTGLATAGYTPYFNAAKAPSIALANAGALGYLVRNEDQLQKTAFQNGLADFGSLDLESHLALVGDSYDKLLDLGELTRQDQETDAITQGMIDNGGSLGRQLAFASDLIESGSGVRVVHAKLGGFDTHNGQRGRHDNLMGQLDAAVGGFMNRMDAAGKGNEVLVAVYSEFGRRIAENDSSGTDHGQASNTLIVGPIKPQIIGDINVADIDDNGNLKTSVPFDSLQRSCAEWLGIEGSSIFGDSATELLF